MRRALLVGLLLALSAPAAPAQGSLSSMAAPAPTAASRWTFDTMLSFDETVNATATLRMAGVEEVALGGGSVRAYRFETVHGDRREGETSITWYRTSDFAKVKVAFVSPAGVTNYTLAQPCGELRFPLRAGAAWSTSCVFREDEGAAFAIHGNWTVAGSERVTTPAGTFDAFELIQRGDTFTERWWFAPHACWWVRHETLGEAGELQAAEVLTSVEGCGGATPPTSTTPGATPTPAASRATPTPAHGGATPAATPTGATPAGSDGEAGAGGAPASGTPGFGVATLLAALAAAGLALRRRR